MKVLYQEVPMCIKGPNGYTPSFPTSIGLKQGCPLSPTLLGFYIEDLEAVILESNENEGLDLPQLSNQVLPPLLYPDDLAIIATTPEGLSKQLKLLEQYAASNGLSILRRQ